MTTAVDEDVCPHCSHLWDNHDGLLTRSKTCDVCGCMWQPPEPEPQPPVEADPVVAGIADAIWAALERQGDEGMGPYVDREMGMVDASGAGLDMTAVAEAVADAILDVQRIAAAIRESLELGDYFGDQFFEGVIDADDLAGAIVRRIGEPPQ